jgi:hypothetical protein
MLKITLGCFALNLKTLGIRAPPSLKSKAIASRSLNPTPGTLSLKELANYC